MRSILALSLLITLCGSANAATVHHAHRRHAIVRPTTRHLGRRPSTGLHRAIFHNEPYFGACQGYAPGEKQRFLDSVRRVFMLTRTTSSSWQREVCSLVETSLTISVQCP